MYKTVFIGLNVRPTVLPHSTSWSMILCIRLIAWFMCFWCSMQQSSAKPTYSYGTKLVDDIYGFIEGNYPKFSTAEHALRETDDEDTCVRDSVAFCY